MKQGPAEIPAGESDDVRLVEQLESLGVAIRRSKAGRVLSVDFQGCQATIDDRIGSQLDRLPRLKEIFLQGSAITDATLESVIRLKRLQVLNVDNTLITDRFIDRFSDRSRLTLLSICGTRISSEKVASLRKKMIGTRIVFR